MLSFFSFCNAIDSLQIHVFLSRVQMKENLAQSQTMGMFKKNSKITKTGQMLPFEKQKKKKENATRGFTEWSLKKKKRATLRTLGLNSVVVILFNILHFCVNVNFHGLSEAVCFMFVIFFFSL